MYAINRGVLRGKIMISVREQVILNQNLFLNDYFLTYKDYYLLVPWGGEYSWAMVYIGTKCRFDCTNDMIMRLI